MRTDWDGMSSNRWSHRPSRSGESCYLFIAMLRPGGCLWSLRSFNRETTVPVSFWHSLPLLALMGRAVARGRRSTAISEGGRCLRWARLGGIVGRPMSGSAERTIVHPPIGLSSVVSGGFLMRYAMSRSKGDCGPHSRDEPLTASSPRGRILVARLIRRARGMAPQSAFERHCTCVFRLVT